MLPEQTASTVSTILKIIYELVKGVKFGGAAKKSSRWILLEELKQNYRTCWLILEENVPIEAILGRFSTEKYDQLNASGYQFSHIKRGKIPEYKWIAGTDLDSWSGKTAEALIRNIYDKIKFIRDVYPFAKDNKNRRWNARIKSIQKRIALLIFFAEK